jgi:hypothetical protein
LAYYRARRQATQPPIGDFWISADANFIDMAVLEWCKLLGDDRADHGWRKIVTDRDRFFAGLLAEVSVDEAQWAAFVAHVRRYRDKFLAHLDSDLVMNIPELDQALRAAIFYYRWILGEELDLAQSGDFPPALTTFYSDRLADGVRVFQIAIPAISASCGDRAAAI